MSTTQRTVPFTPKRSVTSALLLPSTHKKYKAPLTSESKLRSKGPDLTKLKTDPVTSSTSSSRSRLEQARPKSRNEGPFNRPKTPGTPRKDDDDPGNWERDVSRVDPEEELVDASNIDPGDMSGELDAEMLKNLLGDAAMQADDKVMVSVRLRPSTNAIAWATTPSTIKLDSSLSRNPNSTNTNSSTFTFDSILTTQTNRSIYTTVAMPHVHSAMSGYNAVIFAYGQTASGKTHTLSGSDDEPGIIPRAMKDVFSFIRKNEGREYLLRCSYLEIYNETIIDLLASPSMAANNPVQIQGTGDNVTLTPLREEVVISFKGVKDVLKRGEGNRRTACTDWNERSSRSHSVFRLVIESRERGAGGAVSGRQTPGLASGRMTPGGSRLQARGDKSVQTSVLSLIDLAGSEKATSDKDRTREGKYINTSLLTLGSVIGTLAENAAKGKSDHVPYRNSKLTRMLQPSLSGNARISVICTINPELSAITESNSTLLFAKRVKGVALSAKKKEVVDTDALIERYRKEIEDLKKRLAEREEADGQFASGKRRRLSAQEQIDDSKAMKDLNARIQQLTKLILTSQTVSEESGSASRPSSPVKVDFDMEPYQLQQELLAARYQLESQANQILSLEAALVAKPSTSLSTSDLNLAATTENVERDAIVAEKDVIIAEQAARIAMLEDKSAVADLQSKLNEEIKKREERERWAKEVEREMEKEKKLRTQLEEERRALAAFVSKFDSLGLGGFSANSTPASSPAKTVVHPPTTLGTGAFQKTTLSSAIVEEEDEAQTSPIRMSMALLPETQPSLLDEDWGGVYDGGIDVSFEAEMSPVKSNLLKASGMGKKMLGGKENLPVP